MYFEVTLLSTGIITILAFIGVILYLYNKNPALPLILAGILMLFTGLLMANEGMDIQCGTYEQSHVWNCTNWTENYCFGTPEPFSCAPYNETQCNGITGCTWLQGICTGTPTETCEDIGDDWGLEKCRETKGCYVYNETNPHECDSYNITWQYCTQEGDLTTTTDPMNMINLAYILGGLFFILWGATTAFTNPPKQGKQTIME